MRMKQMVTPVEALQIVLDNVCALPPEAVPHAAALGRTLARDVVSNLELPPFDNSSMDGYALLAADVETASPDTPVMLRVLATTAAGDAPQHRVTRGSCLKIMTGAPLPPGADAVVMREETRAENEGEVLILQAARVGQNIRRAGSDVARGERVLRAGTRVRAAEWGMLASLGQHQIEVFRQPRVAIITTGDELAAVGDELKAGQIRDSNSWTLRGLLQSCDAVCAEVRHVRDEEETLRAALRECAATCDAIITSGGVSAGDFDPVRDVLPEVADVRFWKIAMKPGKPVMFAVMNASDGHAVPVFGLPGNPVSVMVAFEQFARPALLKMQGRNAARRVVLRACVEQSFDSPDGKEEFVRARVSPDGSDGWRAHVTGDQGSGRLSTMTAANALLLVPADVTHVEPGTSLNAQMTDWPEIE